MDRKMHEMINKYISEANVETEEQLNEVIQKFMEDYNNGKIEEMENTPLDDAYELLEKASNAKTESQARQLAKRAYEKCDACFDAILFLADLENNSLKRNKILNDGLDKEKQRLTEEGFFVKENIGDFYGIYETRAYIRGLYAKANYLIIEGKLRLAVDVCNEIIRLNENDNMGARYLLMALYATLEEEKPMLELTKKFEEESFEMFFPLMAIYYKQEKHDKAKKYLSLLKNINPNFIKLFRGTLKPNKEIPKGYYSPGDVSEIIMYFTTYNFLTDTMQDLEDFVLEKN